MEKAEQYIQSEYIRSSITDAMPKIYMVNVGANTSHSGSARSPIFNDGTFVFVPFPCGPGKIDSRPCKIDSRPYNDECLPFVRNIDHTHKDPDWHNMTYGDCCSNPRAHSLRSVKIGDILLFWALLWINMGVRWEDFTGKRGWYLIGVLRVEEIAKECQFLNEVSLPNRERAGNNVHFSNGQLSKTDRVFMGNPDYSALFPKAVNLEIDDAHGILYQAFRSAKGQVLHSDTKPHWFASLRSCRAVFDLQDNSERDRAELVRQRILNHNNYDNRFDLLANV